MRRLTGRRLAFASFAIAMMSVAKNIRESEGMKIVVSDDKMAEFNKLAYMEGIPPLILGLSGTAAAIVITDSTLNYLGKPVFMISMILMALSIAVNIYTYGRLKKLFGWK